ncbi:hypothetical protein JXI42_04635 [bacterium]|nr:hypothetical protein [bacterium]
MPTLNIKSDKPMVIIPLEQYESMMETLEILSENPEILKELKAEKNKIGQGKGISYKSFKNKV